MLRDSGKSNFYVHVVLKMLLPMCGFNEPKKHVLGHIQECNAANIRAHSVVHCLVSTRFHKYEVEPFHILKKTGNSIVF